MIADVSFSLVIPVYNEEKRLPQAFDALRAFSQTVPFRSLEIVFVNDGSRDATADVIRDFTCPGACVRLESYDQNRGKGHAVKRGMLAATGDYRLLLDVDMSTPLSETMKLGAGIQDRADVLIGTRKNREAVVLRHQPWIRETMGKVYTMLACVILDVRVSDFTCGFKCFSRSAAQSLFQRSQVDRWSYDAEIVFLAHRNGYRIREIPVVWQNDEATRVRLYKDVIRSFIDLLKIRFRDVRRTDGAR